MATIIGTEVEAARLLVKVARPLDEHVFNDGMPRPPLILLTASDILLLSFWHHVSLQRGGTNRILHMPSKETDPPEIGTLERPQEGSPVTKDGEQQVTNFPIACNSFTT